MAVIQPIGFINRTEADRNAALLELTPYLIGHGRNQDGSAYWPIVHNHFDRRITNLMNRRGTEIQSAATQLNQLLAALRRLRQIATRQRSFLRPAEAARGTSGRGTHARGTRPQQQQQRRPVQQPAAAEPIRNWLTREAGTYVTVTLLPAINTLITNAVTTGSSPLAQQAVRENRMASGINPNYRSQEQFAALGNVGLRMTGFANDIANMSTSGRIVEVSGGQPTDANRADTPTDTMLRSISDRILSTIEGLERRYGNIERLEQNRAYMDSVQSNPGERIQVAENQYNDIDNPYAIKINWNHPDLVPIKFRPHSRGIITQALDLFMAVAIVRYIKELKNRRLGVVEMYTEGFQRDPLGLNDPHPAGRAWDMTGFKVVLNSAGANRTLNGYIILSLRGGHPLHASRGSSAGSPDLTNYTSGPSDWFNLAPMDLQHANDYVDQQLPYTPYPPPPRVQTKQDYLRMLVDVMPFFFGRVHGPGSDQQHMDHFHLDYRTSYPTARQYGYIECPATNENPIPYVPFNRPAAQPRQRASTPAAQGTTGNGGQHR